jgi:hypothetical protein
MLKQFYVPMQCVPLPVNPESHVQVKCPGKFRHVPFSWHGLLLHSLISGK